jgi:hypothetical protein
MKLLDKRWMALVVLAIGGGAVAQPAQPPTDDQHAFLQNEVKEDVQHVIRLQQTARRQHDIIKLTCVNDLLVQIKAEANIFDHTTGGGSEVIQTIRNLRAQADACLGESELVGDSSNSFNAPAFPLDPTQGNPPTPIEPPGYASPFN